jgi:hypothetical protein
MVAIGIGKPPGTWGRSYRVGGQGKGEDNNDEEMGQGAVLGAWL